MQVSLNQIINTHPLSSQQAAPQPLQPPTLPKYLQDNIRFTLFEWQRCAVTRLIAFEDLKKAKNDSSPSHLMFHMATGSGKTLVMASLILYYYQQGYRHFIFFVNQSNIINKTENNFINTWHNKYLFAEKIMIDNRQVYLKKVARFSAEHTDIQIQFTTIQQLYNDIHLVRENQNTLAQLQQLDIVMLADEAHHLNALTKNKKAAIGVAPQTGMAGMDGRTGAVEVERQGWEHTVIELLLHKQGGYPSSANANSHANLNSHANPNRNASSRNVLLEFTATLPDNEAVAKKYADKIIIDFGLKTFLAQGYTKEIHLIATTLAKKQRILLALLFAWYRHRIALKYDIANFKPVVLFRSQSIATSQQDYKDFVALTKTISQQDLTFIEQGWDGNTSINSESTALQQQGKTRIEQLLAFIKRNNIGYAHIAHWIEQNYQKHHVIITNSQTHTSKNEKNDRQVETLLNSLEDANNPVRAIFTVDRLTEGWDVLNLYDIVRLYQGQNAQQKKTKPIAAATIKEKQLIGRGVRYYPFAYANAPVNKRKFDEQPQHELQILEALFYYTHDEDSGYISQLKQALIKDGYMTEAGNKITSAPQSSLRKAGALPALSTLPAGAKQLDTAPDASSNNNSDSNRPLSKATLLSTLALRHEFMATVASVTLVETPVTLAEVANAELQSLSPNHARKKAVIRKVADIEKHIFNKALHIKAQAPQSVYQFQQLRKVLQLDSVDDLQNHLFAHFEIAFLVSANRHYADIDNADKLAAVLQLLQKAEVYLRR